MYLKAQQIFARYHSPLVALCCFLVFVLQATAAHGQQFGYYGYGAIIVSVIDADTKQKIPGLKMYLSYHNGDAVLLSGSSRNKKLTAGACIDSLVFWDNSIPKPEPAYCDDHKLFRQQLPNAGDNYICIVPVTNNKVDTRYFTARQGNNRHSQQAGVPLSNLIYLTIEKVKSSRRNNAYAVQQMRIPIAAVTDICGSNLDGNDGVLRNGYQLQPLVIELKANDTASSASIVSTAFGRYIQPCFTAVEHRLNPEESYYTQQLTKVVLYDEATARIVQTIYPPPSGPGNKVWTGEDLEFGDYYNNPSMPGFKVPSKRIVPGPDEIKNCFTYYTLDTLTRLYKLDTLLTNKQQTWWHDNAHSLHGSSWLDSADFNVERIYKLVDHKWVTIASSAHEKPKPYVPLPTVNVALCNIAQPFKNLPVQYFSKGDTLIVTDTIWVANYGNAKGKISLKYSNYFSAPAVVGPGGTVPLVYRRTYSRTPQGYSSSNVPNRFSQVNGPFDNVTDAVSIMFNDKEYRAGVSYYIINSQASISYQPDSSLHFLIPYKQDEVFFVSIFPGGALSEMGKISLIDSSRIGQWTIIDSTVKGNTKYIHHAKTLLLQLVNGDINACRIFKQYDGGAATEATALNGKIVITDSVRYVYIKKDSGFAAYKIDYTNMQASDGVTLYLLYPGQDFYYWGQIKIPLQLNHKQFAVHWSSSFLYQPGTTPMQQEARKKSYFEALLNTYPNLSYHDIGSDGGDNKLRRHEQSEFYVLDFSGCTPREQMKITDLLQADTNIGALCLLTSPGGRTYCDNHIYIIDNTSKQPDTATIAAALRHGFRYTGTQVAPSSYQHNFQYSSKIVDQKFFAAFNKLCESLNLRRISLNTYAQMYPENPERDMMKK